MEKIVITAGEDFTDIDILACAIAYNELLKKEGKDSVVILPGEFNKSITEKIRMWNISYQNKLENENVNFVIVDISQPEHLAHLVDEKRIIELFDHHFGYEDYWRDNINGKVVIEVVGSCATLIWEEYKKRGFFNSVSNLSANLLYTAIASNTLNFKSSITSPRDITAFKELQQFINLPNDWIEKYFFDQEKPVLENPQKEIKLDTHIEKFPGSEEKLIIGQIELWDSKKFINGYKEDIKIALESFGSSNWFLTSPSINEGKNYFYSESDKVQNLLKQKLGVKFQGNMGITNKLFLRKEIKKIIYNY